MPNTTNTTNRCLPRVGLGSYAYRYTIGCEGFHPSSPMTTIEFLIEAHRLGYQGVQLCENLPIAELEQEQLNEIRKHAERLGLFIELGMRDISIPNVQRYLAIANELQSPFLRIVLGHPASFPEKAPPVLIEKALFTLQTLAPQLEAAGITIGIENHFDLCTSDLAKVVNGMKSDQVGFILDTTNALGFIERPEETLNAFQNRLVSIHLKDYIVEKVEAGYFITGVSLGKGCLCTQAILDSAFQVPTMQSVIVEQTVRRRAEWSLQETTDWERIINEQSVQYLRQIIDWE